MFRLWDINTCLDLLLEGSLAALIHSGSLFSPSKKKYGPQWFRRAACLHSEHSVSCTRAGMWRSRPSVSDSRHLLGALIPPQPSGGLGGTERNLTPLQGRQGHKNTASLMIINCDPCQGPCRAHHFNVSIWGHQSSRRHASPLQTQSLERDGHYR